MQRLLSLTLSLALCSLAHAQIYKTTDENGKVIFTDTPTDKAETVELRETNVAPGSERIKLPAKGAPKSTPELPPYQLYISSPAPETHLNPGDRNLTVSYEVNRKLEPGLRFQLLSNGEPIGNSSTGNSITVSEIHRGEHQISVIVYDEDQRVLAESTPVAVYVHRAQVRTPTQRN